MIEMESKNKTIDKVEQLFKKTYRSKRNLNIENVLELGPHLLYVVEEEKEDENKEQGTDGEIEVNILSGKNVIYAGSFDDDIGIQDEIGIQTSNSSPLSMNEKNKSTPM